MGNTTCLKKSLTKPKKFSHKTLNQSMLYPSYSARAVDLAVHRRGQRREQNNI